MGNRNTPPGLVLVGFQALSLADSTALGLSSTNQLADVLDIAVETQPARFRADSTAPTLSTGVLLEKDVHHRLENMRPLMANLKFQRTTGTATVSVQAYRYAGQGT